MNFLAALEEKSVRIGVKRFIFISVKTYYHYPKVYDLCIVIFTYVSKVYHLKTIKFVQHFSDSPSSSFEIISLNQKGVLKLTFLRQLH